VFREDFDSGRYVNIFSRDTFPVDMYVLTRIAASWQAATDFSNLLHSVSS